MNTIPDSWLDILKEDNKDRALSQNMMHDSTNTTDKYTGFINDEVGNIISTFKPDD